MADQRNRLSSSDTICSSISISDEEDDDVFANEVPQNGPTQRRKRIYSNEKERFRLRTVNKAFEELESVLPVHPPNKKMKKREVLIRSIKYIALLKDLIDTLDSSPADPSAEESRMDNSPAISDISVMENQFEPCASGSDFIGVCHLAQQSDLPDELDYLLADLESICQESP